MKSTLFLILFFICFGQNAAETISNLVIKDDGIVELEKGDMAMIFYLTATNTGREPMHLSVNGTKCCLKIPEGEEEDCDSMALYGGDQGELYPEDTRNLTLIYPTMYAHDQTGFCQIEVIADDGKKMEKKIEFSTEMPKSPDARIPRLLESYYDAEDRMTCQKYDEDPLNLCHPALCLFKYSGHKNFYNDTSSECEKVPSCISKNKEIPTTAYVPESNSCHELENELVEAEKEELRQGKPSVHELSHLHRYPLNMRCHQGTMDPVTSRCVCHKNWGSEHFEPSTFNFDIQVYHMCTVWKGEPGAPEAANVTFTGKQEHGFTSITLFSILGGVIVFLGASMFAIYLFKSRQPKIAQGSQDDETAGLMPTDNQTDVDDDPDDRGL